MRNPMTWETSEIEPNVPKTEDDSSFPAEL